MPEVSERWDKYKGSIYKAKKAYLSKKKSISLVLDPEIYEEIKAYSIENGVSLQSLFRDSVLEKIRNG